MSDGYPFNDVMSACDAFAAEHAEAASPHAPRARAMRGAVPLDIGRLAEWLPRLGTMLWLERREAAMSAPQRISAGSRLMLLEHVASGLLGRSASLRAHSAVSPHGPREWLSAHAGDGAINAKLFLLPDSDCYAWDQMNTALGLAPTEAARNEPPTHGTFLQRALARFGHPWQARLLAFDLKPLPWLHILGAHPPLRISLLGLDIARGIVRDEHAEWISPLHFD